MKIFGVKVKWPQKLRTKRSVIKQMLREKGNIQTVRFLKREWSWNQFKVNVYLFDLIRDGVIDYDLYRLFKIDGNWELQKKLVRVYRMNPYRLKIYNAEIQKLDKYLLKNKK